MCSQSCGSRRCNIHEFPFQRAVNMHASEEWEDTDDDSDYFNLGRKGKYVNVQETSDFKKGAPTKIRAKSVEVRGSCRQSSKGKIKDWHVSSVVNQKAELRARRYSEMVMDDTMEHLFHTIRTAGSIVEKGEAINNELSRQDHVLSKAETDISIAEYETDEVTQTLKGMGSLRGKLKRVIWQKQPTLRRTEFDSKRSTFSNVSFDGLPEDVGLCAFSKMNSKPSSLSKEKSEDAHQIQFKAGLGELSKALDIMTVQQKETAWAIESSEGRLSMFEDQVTSTNNKINRQSQMINRIMGKS